MQPKSTLQHPHALHNLQGLTPTPVGRHTLLFIISFLLVFPLLLFYSLSPCILWCHLLQEACPEFSMNCLWTFCKNLYPSTMLYVKYLFWELYPHWPINILRVEIMKCWALQLASGVTPSKALHLLRLSELVSSSVKRE